MTAHLQHRRIKRDKFGWRENEIHVREMPVVARHENCTDGLRVERRLKRLSSIKTKRRST